MPRENKKRRVREIACKEGEESGEAMANGESVVASPDLTMKPPVRRRKGKLSLLPNLSIDILFEVFVYLQPLDLLNIMYTSKGFRDLLIAPSSVFIWKAVRMNIEDIPDCPPHLSEVAYAKLAFYPYCYRCGKRTPNTPQWEVLARFCGPCLDVILTPTFMVPDWISNKPSYMNILGVIHNTQRCKGRYSLHCHFKPQVKKLLKHTQNLSETSSVAWIADAQRKAPGIREHAELCREWDTTVRIRRLTQLNEKKAKRRDDIHKRLSQLGFGPALARVAGDFSYHRLVKSGVGLSERIWTNIKPVLVSWIQEHETKHLARSALTAYTTSHPDIFLPGIADFMASSDIKQILDHLRDVPVSEEAFADMAIFMDNWRRTATLQLADLVESSRRHDRVASFAKLDLATTVFSCLCMRQVQVSNMDHARQLFMHYPWVMAHPCVTNERCTDSEDRLWDIKNLRYEGESGNRVVKPIIEACGLPHETTRTSDMDALDPRLICLHCRRGNENAKNITVYTWRSAIGHALICPHKKPHIGYSWHSLSDEATKNAKADTSSIYRRKIVGDAAREAEIQQWGCTQCRDRKDRNVYTIEEVKSHYAHEHKGFDPLYYRVARCPPGMFDLSLPADQCDE
ncbi:hypothetical protein BD410DRAFT_433370 [Rickenella mellea]|uniref:F-box domain-containing protein n=1 Tax=Rickenella mellea TaxID=50990 RepID=A0A4Y7PWZ6_9AGAM|nr:hypothetical protein BD410DRAFT_433370 [Rickenella mellea]